MLFAAALLVISVVRGGDAPAPPPLAAATPRALPDGSIGELDWRGLANEERQQAAVSDHLRLRRPVYCSGGRAGVAALTFDDGPTVYSEAALRSLRDHGAQATFFVVGRQVAALDAVVRRQATLGAVGNHTWSHPDLRRLRPAAIARQLARAGQAIERSTGEPVRLFRPPYALRSRAVDTAARDAGMLQVLWSIDSEDYTGNGTAAAAGNVVRALRPGAIVLLHDSYEWSVRAIPRIVAAARRRGLRLVTVPQLLALDPLTSAQARAGRRACQG